MVLVGKTSGCSNLLHLPEVKDLKSAVVWPFVMYHTVDSTLGLPSMPYVFYIIILIRQKTWQSTWYKYNSLQMSGVCGHADRKAKSPKWWIWKLLLGLISYYKRTWLDIIIVNYAINSLPYLLCYLCTWLGQSSGEHVLYLARLHTPNTQYFQATKCDIKIRFHLRHSERGTLRMTLHFRISNTKSMILTRVTVICPVPVKMTMACL